MKPIYIMLFTAMIVTYSTFESFNAVNHYSKYPDVDYCGSIIPVKIKLLKIFNQNDAKWFSFCTLTANAVLLLINFYIILFKKYEDISNKQHVE